MLTVCLICLYQNEINWVAQQDTRKRDDFEEITWIAPQDTNSPEWGEDYDMKAKATQTDRVERGNVHFLRAMEWLIFFRLDLLEYHWPRLSVYPPIRPSIPPR